MALDWIESQLNDEKLFPTSEPFPRNYQKVVSKIMTKILRIYAHIVYEHFRDLKKMEMDKQLNLSLKHFMAFVYTFDLVSPAELEVFKDWSLSHLNIDILKKKKKVGTKGASDYSSLTVNVVNLQNLSIEENDFYFSIQLGSQEEKTELKKNNWNEQFTFLITDTENKEQMMKFTMFEKSLLSFKEIGSFEFLVHKYFDEKDHQELFKVKRKDKNISDLSLKIKFTSSQTGTMKYLMELTNVQYYKELINFLTKLNSQEWVYLFDNNKTSIEEKIWKSIIYSNPNIYDMLEKLIEIEVNQCQSATTLFRANSMATKLLNSFTKMVGNDYLSNILDFHIKKIMSDDLYLEVDPTKAKENTKCDENMKIILHLSNLILESIFDSIKIFPTPLSRIIKIMEKLVYEKFKDEKIIMTSITGVVMLRFICPAIITPELFQFRDIPKKNPRRTLTLISKIIQNLANGIVFKDKEQYMLPANEIISKNIDEMKKFLFSTSKSSEDRKLPFKIDDTQYLWSLYNLHDFFYQNKDKYNEKKVNDYPMDEKVYDELIYNLFIVIDKVGKPPNLTLDSRQKVSTSTKYSKK